MKVQVILFRLALLATALRLSHGCATTCPGDCSQYYKYGIGASNSGAVTVYRSDANCRAGTVASILAVKLYTTDDDKLLVTSISTGFYSNSDNPGCYHYITTANPSSARDVRIGLYCGNIIETCDFYILFDYECTKLTTLADSTQCCYNDQGINMISTTFIQCNGSTPSVGMSTASNRVVVKYSDGSVMPYCPKPTPAPTTPSPTPAPTPPPTPSPPTTTTPSTSPVSIYTGGSNNAKWTVTSRLVAALGAFATLILALA
jgi:hypothetical protein